MMLGVIVMQDFVFTFKQMEMACICILFYEYKHELLEEEYCAMLLAHGKMTWSDILQMENFKKARIPLRLCQIGRAHV